MYACRPMYVKIIRVINGVLYCTCCRSKASTEPDTVVRHYLHDAVVYCVPCHHLFHDHHGLIYEGQVSTVRLSAV